MFIISLDQQIKLFNNNQLIAPARAALQFRLRKESKLNYERAITLASINNQSGSAHYFTKSLNQSYLADCVSASLRAVTH